MPVKKMPRDSNSAMPIPALIQVKAAKPGSVSLKPHLFSLEENPMNQIVRLLGLPLFVLTALSACHTSFRFPMEKGDITRGREAFVRLGCPQCHTVAGVDLSSYSGQHLITMPLGGELVSARTYGDLVTSIVNPNHVISDVYLDQLPADHRRRANTSPMYTELDMKVTELVDIVAFLNSRYSVLPGYTEYEYEAFPGTGPRMNP